MVSSGRAAAVCDPRTKSVLLLIAVVCLACNPSPASGQATDAPTISRQAFSSLRWLEGRWVGSGGGFTAFYEEYAVLNDTTIEQREFPDSTFARPGGTSSIEWRNGKVQKLRRGQAQTFLARVAGDTARFESTVAGRGGFTWLRVGADAWRAILDGRSTSTIYELKRVKQSR